jgi:hypothetical protein
MKACVGSGCIDPHFLDLWTIWRWVVSFTPGPLYSWGKGPRYPLDRRLAWRHNRSGRRGEKKILDPTGTRTPTPRVAQPVASRYTGYAIPAPHKYTVQLLKWIQPERVHIYFSKQYKRNGTSSCAQYEVPTYGSCTCLFHKGVYQFRLISYRRYVLEFGFLSPLYKLQKSEADIYEHCLIALLPFSF